MNGSVRPRLMTIGEMELEVVHSGVWQIDLAQPRAPAGVRTAYMSTEGILSALETRRIWGLSGLEVACAWDAGEGPYTGTCRLHVPDGVDEDFWVRLGHAHAALQSRILEQDVDTVLGHLQEAREYRQRCGIVDDGNRLFDPGVT